ncbi:gap junction Cx32.2 protein-like [Xyrauchen texanus]|uniref:gap junction Cx32.2 protein-like n=1 Tax=Xyrauchen texanus TaxID=154827 RepID=UPI0022429316|nr:gap junction Cx32.2 protein-like [Xyrauchen texanus]XP_051955115.1 gap junction Cx32.2 protein-like [Xyrauchen texanus]
MGDWGFLSKLLDKVQSHSTNIGKVWLTVLLIFRIMVLGAGLDKVWGDEQSSMVCNIKTPGCLNACYDTAFPISHMRFWVLQFIFVATPTLLYFGYVLHVIHKENKLRRQLQNKAEISGVKLPKYTDDNGKVYYKGSLLGCYMMSLILTIVFEAGFIVGQHYLIGLWMPKKMDCYVEPCPKVGLHCFTSRPTEKTIFIIFMLAIACVSLALNVGEIFYLMGQRAKHRKHPTFEIQNRTPTETFC